MDHFVIGGDFPTRTVLNLEHRVPKADLGSRRDGMCDQSIIEKFSTDPALSPGFIWKLKSNRASCQIKELDPAQFGRRNSINDFADTQTIQDFPGTWVQAIATDFLSGKLSPFEDQGR